MHEEKELDGRERDDLAVSTRLAGSLGSRTGRVPSVSTERPLRISAASYFPRGLFFMAFVIHYLNSEI